MTTRLTPDDYTEITEFIDGLEEAGILRSRSKRANTPEEMREHWRVGKASEQAVCRFLEETYGVSCEIDTRVYDGVRADDGDIWRYRADGDWHEAEPCEIKKTGTRSRHVAITRAEASLISDEEPIVYVKTDYPDSDEFEVVGWCLKEDLEWTEKGATPWTQDYDNLCQPLDEMRTDWHEFLSRVCPEAEPESRFTFSE